MAKRKKTNRFLEVMAGILALVLIAMVILALKMPEPTIKPQPEATAPPQTTAPAGDTPDPTQVTTEPPTEATTEPPTEPEAVSMRVVADSQARTAPEDTAAVAADLSLGTMVEVTATEGGWCAFDWEGQTCYLPEAVLREENQYLIVIDAGHQRKGNYDKEPLGPGSDEMKAKVTSGTQGVVTKLEEYKLNLSVALKLQAQLEQRGYQVVMVRTDHDVDISNAQRAEVANGLYADAFIRIHANSSDDSTVSGALTICQTAANPYNGSLYAASKALSQKVLKGLCAAAGCTEKYVWETDTMSGINWCQVPVTIVEMGFMSNPEEDRLMADESYQEKMASGIADGIDSYFEKASG